MSDYAPGMTELVDAIAAARDGDALRGRMLQDVMMPANQTGAYATYDFDLSGTVAPNITNPQGVDFSVSGYKILYVRENSASGGQLDIEVGGQLVGVAPGDRLIVPFNNFRVRRSANSVVTGNARIVVCLAPAIDYQENQSINRSGALGVTTVAQTANGTSNTPSAATGGASLQGVKGLRVIVSAAAAQTLSGAGTIRFWYYSHGLARWAYNPETDIALGFAAATHRDIVLADREVLASDGRVFVEARSVTVSGGDLSVRLETWG